MYQLIIFCLCVAVVSSHTCPQNYLCHRKEIYDTPQCYELSVKGGYNIVGIPCEAQNITVSQVEALRYLDKDQMRPVLSQAWQKALNTKEDPANGKWYENGANGDGIGLYGGLDDSVDTTVFLDDAHKTFSSQQTSVSIFDADNTNGLNPDVTATLSFTHSFTQEQSHTVAHQYNYGVGVDVTAKAEIFGIGADITTKFSFDYTYSLSDTKSTSTTDTVTTEISMPLIVPTGRIYRAILQSSHQTLTVPTASYIYVRGTTETWFNDRVDGHYNYVTDAATMFSWINQYGTAGADSSLYQASNGVGVLVSKGSIEGQNYVHMCTNVYDITNNTNKIIQSNC